MTPSAATRPARASADVFYLYGAWVDLPGRGPVNASREAIARGQDVFNFTKINIRGVAGINDVPRTACLSGGVRYLPRFA